MDPQDTILPSLTQPSPEPQRDKTHQSRVLGVARGQICISKFLSIPMLTQPPRRCCLQGVTLGFTSPGGNVNKQRWAAEDGRGREVTNIYKEAPIALPEYHKELLKHVYAHRLRGAKH